MEISRRYILITPTKNEAEFIGQTINSVIAQTLQPLQWIVVSDGSTDSTNQIVGEAAASHPWITLLPLARDGKRDFGAVVHATEAGIRAITETDYHYIGLLDSDVSFQADYFEKVLQEFERAPALGLAGGVVIDPGHAKNRLPRNREDVPGAVQFFRRKCFEELGGLIAIPEGGWDALTCARARLLGYSTRLLTDLVVDHLKPRNISEGGLLRRNFQLGVRDYALGCHPLFEGAKCIGRLAEPPVVAGAVARAAGYAHAMLQGRQHILPTDLLQFVREEQKKRLARKILFRG